MFTHLKQCHLALGYSVDLLVLTPHLCDLWWGSAGGLSPYCLTAAREGNGPFAHIPPLLLSHRGLHIPNQIHNITGFWGSHSLVSKQKIQENVMKIWVLFQMLMYLAVIMFKIWVIKWKESWEGGMFCLQPYAFEHLEKVFVTSFFFNNVCRLKQIPLAGNSGRAHSDLSSSPFPQGRFPECRLVGQTQTPAAAKDRHPKHLPGVWQLGGVSHQPTSPGSGGCSPPKTGGPRATSGISGDNSSSLQRKEGCRGRGWGFCDYHTRIQYFFSLSETAADR